MTYNPSEALARIDNDKALLVMLIGVFLKECPSYCERLDQASQQQEVKHLGDVAHNVKGASSAIGFESARSMAAHLEELCRKTENPDPALYRKLTQELIAELTMSEQPLKGWIAQQG